MKLYFQNSSGKDILIADVDSEEAAVKRIKKFCRERDYIIPYFRCWGDLDKDGITYDTGSWSEFFKLVKD